ncbi:MAG: MmgE/PrpD family protein [Gammaproteobacteria bacterium]|jgi:2-methylcitrate dehydratase PrpD|nr:MmgE/PrpD family protein [Gammaproteobacteria bacterium]
MNQNPLRAYGAWLASVPAEWPADALESAHRQLIDIVAVMLPGAATPVAKTVLRRAQDWGRGNSTVVGSDIKLALPWAAMVNATAGHALDFDDNFDPAKAHVSTVLWPTILAVAEQEKCSAAQCLDAYIAALQIQGRIGQGLNPVHRKRGWHATATTGVLGAAAATARLLGLDATRAAMALSIATSMAGGFMSQFGTMTKPMHAGLAAKGGIMAAYLAMDGMTAGWDTLAGRTGMNTLMVGPDREQIAATIERPQHGQTLRFVTTDIGSPLLILEHKFRVKRFPTCGSAHRSLDAMLTILSRESFELAEIRRIDVHAPDLHLNNLMYERPQTGLQGKFSVEYPLACVLVDGDCVLADFTDDAVQRPTHRAMLEKIHRHPINQPETETDTTLIVTLQDGRKIEEVVFMPQGSKLAPFPTSQYWRKLHSSTAGLLADEQAAALVQKLTDFPELAAAGELMTALGVNLQPIEAGWATA